MDDRRQKNQEQLALPFAGGSEAGLSEAKGIEASRARRETESPAGNQRMMEAICERENCGEYGGGYATPSGDSGKPAASVLRNWCGGEWMRRRPRKWPALGSARGA
jgi:hypothetical protein